MIQGKRGRAVPEHHRQVLQQAAQGFHEANSRAGSAPWRSPLAHQPQRTISKSGRPQRKAEWQCQMCGTTNFLTRDKCRHSNCGAPIADACVIIQPNTQTETQPTARVAPKPANTQPQADTAKAAEAALAAAKAANLPPATLASLEEEANRRRQQEAMRLPLANRLQAATAAANKAAQVKAKAQKAHEAAKQAIADAEQALREATEAETEAAATLQKVSSEVGQDKEHAPSGPTPQLRSPMRALVQALRAADTPADPALLAAPTEAEKVLAVDEPPADATRKTETSEEPPPTQTGDVDLTDEVADQMIAALASNGEDSVDTKRRKLREALAVRNGPYSRG